MVKRLATLPHDPLGITDSAYKNQSVMVTNTVRYRFNSNIPIRSTTIGKSRVSIDPKTMHTSWRSNSGIACVTRSIRYGSELEVAGNWRSRTPQNSPQVLNTLSSVSLRESRIQYLCDPQWFRDTASHGPTTIVAPESQFRTCPSDHDSIGYPRMSASGESSTTMHRLLHTSGSHPIPPTDDPKTNQYNQDLGLIHSTNGKHLESPNEGSSIDHQVTIYLHAQNITMFPTN
ncbi:hypothetical protein F511_09422 [Dorcoceras hygrometricum]|uniref:Uncharacterized protein n=1 Tax=Dorcoceras hygrometricum TaxID=472368 RepID=A0A2Z7AK88_9LAMI|nr:hypothetical protein F511_09422 [Dorcoceras hygrometricum]